MGGILNSFWKLIVILVLVNVFEKVASNVTQAPTCGCGVSPKSRRIFGGTNTTIDQFRWTALILGRFGPDSEFSGEYVQCGGSIIASSYVLSAAHCFTAKGIENVWVLVGGNNLNNANLTSMPVTKVLIHEDFNKTSYSSNDIAILTLQTPVQFSSLVQKACLPPPGMNLDNTNVTVIGWGLEKEGGPVANTLQYATIPVVSTTQCMKKFNNSDIVIDDSFVCAGTDDGSRNACQGDSGGPLVYDCQGRYTLAGIVSFGSECGSTYPVAYTNVSFFYDWIVENTPNADLCEYVCYPPVQ